MKIEIKNENTFDKTLVYQENFWTGKITLSYDGQELTKIKRNLFQLEVDGKIEEIVVTGNQAIGVSVSMFGKNIEVVRKPTWYEWLLAVLAFCGGMAIIIAGSSMGNLSVGMGTFFGTLCGAISGGVSFTSLVIGRQIDKLWVRLVVLVELVLLVLALCGFLGNIAFKAF